MLQINDKYRIKAIDHHNIIPEVYRYSKSKRKDMEGTYKWMEMGYYPTVQSACLGILTCEANDVVTNDELTVREFIKQMDEIRDDIVKVTKNIKVVKTSKRYGEE